MANDMVIEVENVSKRFRLRTAGARTLKSAVLESLRRRGGGAEFYALRDINFKVRAGQTLGIIGANGAGKSTLLAVLAGTMSPSAGRVRTTGRISTLLELGAGFHPDLSGRDNVYLYGAIMGLPRRVMRERFDAIVDFAELRTFIDQPVKHYSSGMYVRLGFAVAVEADPDILLVDEVLAVGDAAFRRKCLRRMTEFRKRRKAMVVVSHDLETIRSMSDRIVFLDEGRIVGDGEPGEMVRRYEQAARQKGSGGLQREWGTREVEITGVEFLDAAGRAADEFAWGDALQARIRYRADRRIDQPVFGYAIATDTGLLINGNNTQIENVEIPFIEGEGSIVLRIDRLTMSRGVYLFSFSVHSADHRTNYHRLDNVFPISIKAEKNFEGAVYLPCRWTVE
jgi:ABC-type polysaccharide/polyol phosphate transport system ATPase subunit